MNKYYYNQADPRWANKLYTSTNNPNQTMKSSGCGPASGAMIVSSMKEIILPDEMADLFVANGFRSASNGTYWSAFPWIAKKWNLEYDQNNNLDSAIENLRSGGMVIAACGNGLFTTNGHILVIVSIDNNTLLIYDPYLYNGKFDINEREGKATVDGINVYCSIDNFKNYANYSQFFCYKLNSSSSDSDNGSGASNISTVGQIKTFNKPTTIYENSNLTGNKYNYLANTTVEILQNFDTVDKVKSTITGRIGYVYNVGLYKENSTPSTSSTVGQVKTFKNDTIIYENSNLTGNKYNYLANTTVEILENLGDIDKVKSRITGRIGYVKNNVYK